MPNIRQQIVGLLGDKAPSALPGDQVGIYIMASDGREAMLTKLAVQARYQLETGSAASRKSKTITWVKDQLVAALGPEQIDALFIELDFDPADGTPSLLEVSA